MNMLAVNNRRKTVGNGHRTHFNAVFQRRCLGESPKTVFNCWGESPKTVLG